MATDALGPRTGSSTRLLILGCVRIFQPVHGYFLRRELLSWHVDSWASVHPGSIYNALRSLTSQGLLDEVGTSTSGSRPARTSYRLTTAGESTYDALLRRGITTVDDPTAFLVAISFASALTRDEVVGLVTARADALAALLDDLARQIAELLAGDDSPPSASEAMRVMSARLAGELEWCTGYLDRIRSGAYSFLGEEPDWTPSPEQVAEAAASGAWLGTSPQDPGARST